MSTPPTTFVPADPDFRRRVAESFERQQAMHTLNIRLAQVEPGFVALTMPFQAALGQQHGFIHAGILATALDSACGYAAFTLMPANAAVLSIEFKINLLSPARGEEFSFQAHVVRPGRTITVCQAEAVALGAAKSTVVAVMTATMMTVLDRPDVKG